MTMSFKKRIYGLIILVISVFSKLFLSKKRYNKTVIISDFMQENVHSINSIYELKKDSVLFAKKKNKYLIDTIESNKLQCNSITFLLKIIPLLTKSDLVVCDNYFPFLASYIKPKEQKLIQIWHADGAIKNFGIKSNEINSKTKFEVTTYKKVYSKFDKYICASRNMAEGFIRNYEISPAKIKIVGSIKTEYLINAKNKYRQNVINSNKYLENKKVVLYAPTYKPYDYDYKKIVDEIYSRFGRDYFIIIKYHPKTKIRYRQNLHEYKIDELMTLADIFITDYSSTIFKYLSINYVGQAFMLWDDYEKYSKVISVNDKFAKENQEIICRSTDELFRKISDESIISKNNNNTIIVNSTNAKMKLQKEILK